MAMPTLEGKHFTISAGNIALFHLQGLHSRSNWAMGIPRQPNNPESYLLMEMDPAPVLRKIVDVIERDRANGREQLIDHVLVSNRVAVRLFLEGSMTIDAFTDAQETEESIVIMLPLAGKVRRVKIQSEFLLDHEISTRDAQGNIV